MLTPEDRARIEEEERYRVEVRERLAAPTPKPDPPKRSVLWEVLAVGGFALIFILVFFALISGNPGTTEPEPVREGETVSLRGAVADAGIADYSRLPYFNVEGGQYRAKCYYIAGGVPPRGQIVSVKGKVTASQGGWMVLRPCYVQP